MGIQTLGNLLFNTIKCTTTYKEDVTGIYRNHLLVGMLASTLRRNVYHRTFKKFQQTLLNTFTANIKAENDYRTTSAASSRSGC